MTRESPWQLTSTALRIVVDLVDGERDEAKYLIESTDPADMARLVRHVAAVGAHLIDYYGAREYAGTLTACAADRLLCEALT